MFFVAKQYSQDHQSYLKMVKSPSGVLKIRNARPIFLGEFIMRLNFDALKIVVHVYE